MSSSKVYNTSYGRGTQQLLEMSERDKQSAIEFGKLAYSQYNPYFQRFVTTEITTNRTITCLYSGKDPKTKKNVYKKWYFRPECQGKYDYNCTVKGDFGIDISEEEYKKLDVISPTYTHLPTDRQVLNKLMWGRERTN